MIRYARAVACCLGTVLLPLAAEAGSADYIPNLRATVGTQGFGGELSETLVPRYLSVSAQANYFSISHDFTRDGDRYDGHARLFTAGLLLNVNPFANGFRISAGAYNNQNRLRADTTEPVTVLGVPVASHASVTAKFKTFAPYAGVGWTWGQRITASVDGGVMFMGKAHTHFVVDCEVPACQAAAAQDEQQVRDEVDQYRYYPVLRFGLGF